MSFFGFGASKKNASHGQRTQWVGIDLTASRIRAIVAGAGRIQSIPLEEQSTELPLFVNMDLRQLVVGHQARAICRKSPHSICSNFLGDIGEAKEWRGYRHTLTPTLATAAAFKAIHDPILQESDASAIALPLYLKPSQVQNILEQTTEARLPIRGSITAPLAVVATHRSQALPAPAPGTDHTIVLWIDVDEYALSAALIQVRPTEARYVSGGYWPKGSLKIWKDALIDGMADRCVRLCRRDPRDSADAEQSLYDQIDGTLDLARAGQKSTTTIRVEHWYQDLVQTPQDLENYCLPVLRLCLDSLKGFLQNAGAGNNPRAVWLSHSAGLLPGFANRIYRYSASNSAVSVLPASATAEAVASLVPQWLTGQLPTNFVQAVLPLDPTGSRKPLRLPEQPHSEPGDHFPKSFVSPPVKSR